MPKPGFRFFVVIGFDYSSSHSIWLKSAKSRYRFWDFSKFWPSKQLSCLKSYRTWHWLQHESAQNSATCLILCVLERLLDLEPPSRHAHILPVSENNLGSTLNTKAKTFCGRKSFRDFSTYCIQIRLTFLFQNSILKYREKVRKNSPNYNCMKYQI